MMVITTRKVRRCASWAYVLDGWRRRVRCWREVGHHGNHVHVDATMSWGNKQKAHERD